MSTRFHSGAAIRSLVAQTWHYGRRFWAKKLPSGAITSIARCGANREEPTRTMRDHAHTLSDFRVPTRSIECEPCGRRGRYNIARLMERYGDAKLPELRHVLANCPKAKSSSVYDQCKVRYGEDSRF